MKSQTLKLDFDREEFITISLDLRTVGEAVNSGTPLYANGPPYLVVFSV
jgi:hypothetical protein